jgi:hypothetical protein
LARFGIHLNDIDRELGFLLPNSVRIWRELRRPEPDRERIVRLNRINIWLAGMQGLMQIAIILVMTKYVS